MSNYKCCKKHQEYRAFNRLHYGSCLYCLIDGEDHGEDWDSWEEVALRAGKISQMGFLDAKNGLVYEPTSEKAPAKKSLKQKVDRVKFLNEGVYQLYMAGVKMWNDQLEEQPKAETETFPTGYDQKKYDELKEKIDALFDRRTHDGLPIENEKDDEEESEEASDEKKYVEIDSLEIMHKHKDYVVCDFLCAKKSRENAMHRIYEMLEEEGF